MERSHPLVDLANTGQDEKIKFFLVKKSLNENVCLEALNSISYGNASIERGVKFRAR